MKKRRWESGFTLIELLVVLAVIGTLLALSGPRFIGTVNRSKEVALRHNLKVLREALDKYKGYEGKYPARLSELVEKKFLREVPMDPFTESASSWVTSGEGSGSEEGGITDVHSGAKDVASDGAKVSTW